MITRLKVYPAPALTVEQPTRGLFLPSGGFWLHGRDDLNGKKLYPIGAGCWIWEEITE